MNKFIACAASFILVGCVSTSVVSSSESQVLVEGRPNDMAVIQQKANAECGKYARSARLNQEVRGNKVWSTFIFDCHR